MTTHDLCLAIDKLRHWEHNFSVTTKIQRLVETGGWAIEWWFFSVEGSVSLSARTPEQMLAKVADAYSVGLEQGEGDLALANVEGLPANKQTKSARGRAHAVFGAMRAAKGWKRREGYVWMQTALGMTKEQAHIANFMEADCERLIAACAAEVALFASDPTIRAAGPYKSAADRNREKQRRRRKAMSRKLAHEQEAGRTSQ